MEDVQLTYLYSLYGTESCWFKSRQVQLFCHPFLQYAPNVLKWDRLVGTNLPNNGVGMSSRLLTLGLEHALLSAVKYIQVINIHLHFSLYNL